MAEVGEINGVEMARKLFMEIKIKEVDSDEDAEA